MRIALITEGVSEFKNLPKLAPELGRRSGNIVLNPLKINVSPDAPPPIIARECKSRLLLAKSQRADLVIVCLDREDQEDCPGKIAGRIENAISKSCPPSLLVRVVLKNRAFENWLVADLDALRAQPSRFRVTQAHARRVQPNKADSCDAYGLLTSVAIGVSYDKVPDSARICLKLDVARAAAHSRSFRHFLHLVGDAAYQTQCRLPAQGA